MKKIILVILVISIGILSCKKKDIDAMVDDKITTPVSDTISKGDFIGVAHSVSGKAILYSEASGNKILRLENFNMTSAPDPDILLSKTSNYVANNVIVVKQLDKETNYSNSNINIDLDDAINVSEYPYVIVWCTEFSAYFGHAPLQ